MYALQWTIHLLLKARKAKSFAIVGGRELSCTKLRFDKIFSQTIITYTDQINVEESRN